MSILPPSCFIDENKNKSYEELLRVRWNLIREILNFEKNIDTYVKNENQIHPAPDSVYLIELDYLSELCKLIADKFEQKYNKNL